MRQLLATITTLLAAATLQAQVGKYRSDLAIGVNSGIAMNSVSFKPSVPQNMHMGLEMGITLRYTCEKYFSAVCALQTEINYTQLGWKEDIQTSDDTYRRTQSYISIPFLARLGWGRERKGFMGYVILGPQIGFCIGESETKTGPWDAATLSLREGRTEQYDLKCQKKFAYGITAGAGLEFSRPKVGHFTLEARYNFGLSDIFDNSKRDPFQRSANSTISIKLTYLYDILKTKTGTIR